MGANFSLLALLIANYSANLVLSASPGFIFPANDTSLEATLSNITAHFNDSMIVEYTPGVGETVLLGQSWYASSENPRQEYSENSQTYYLSSLCILIWDVGNGNNDNSTVINFCLLTIQGFTIYEFAWGPFGLTSFNQAAESVYYLASVMFIMLHPTAQPARITNPAGMASQSSTPVTATASGKATCPPSGIPPMPIVKPVPQIDLHAPMAEGVVFLSEP